MLIRELKCVFLAGRWGRRVQMHLVFSTGKTPSQEGTLLYNKHITHGNILERFYCGVLENMSGVRPGGHWLRLHLPAQGGGFDPWAGSSDPTCFMAKKPKHKTMVL